MTTGIPGRKLIKTAFFTTVILIGALAVTPHVLVFKSFSATALLNGIFFLALFIFLIWSINISLIYLTEKRGEEKFPAWKRYMVSYIICLPCVLLANLIIKTFIHNTGRAPAHLYAVFVLALILNTIVLILQDLILLRERKSRIELENAALKIKNMEATNQQLKQQIHPHFLFNSLNTLKALIKTSPMQAGEYLAMLSDFLRASLLSATPNVVRLSEEIKICHDYLKMQKMRFGKALQYVINIPDEVQDSVFVPVFSLLPLLENAVKHNKLTRESPLHIQMDFIDGRIITSNNIQSKLAAEPSTGLGLANLAERYRILSGEEVIIFQNERTFSVSIKALSDENCNYRR